MERWRAGMHYFSIPGGGIELGETARQTVVREILEETSITVETDRKVLEMRDGAFRHRIYLCRYVSGEPYLPSRAPEALHMTDDNRFKPGWMPIAELSKLPFTYWEPLRQPLIKGLQNGFGKTVIIVNAATAG
jgi:8-oxo-dGTP pyrophosphatase MutT (NUDIX family)